MKNIVLLISILLFSNACTQNFISYVKTSPRKPLFSMDEVLLETGLIYPDEMVESKRNSTNKKYPTGVLIPKTPELAQTYYTIEVANETAFTINVATKNYLVITPYYSSPGIVYQADDSKPKQGIFNFFIVGDSGIVRMRIYSPEGILLEEQIWYIEVPIIN